MANTLFDKIWDAHVVQKVEEGPTQLYIDPKISAWLISV